ncbi:MAG: prepilin-type N-terminal cleavage/methylation domain-containing protein [Elusimicrobiaceae bacterium]|nr:prepilin-type N-terminal cleavage/methylation domain-containing protein [Elusimicrobiaceae bacterium]
MKEEKSSKTTNKGFTLIELLVVVLIIGILAAIALPQYRLAIDKTKFYKLKSFAKPFVVAYQNFYMIHNTYPSDFEDLDISLPDGYIKKTTHNGTASCGIMNDFYCCMVPHGSSTTAAITCGYNDYSFGLWIINPHTKPYLYCVIQKENKRMEKLCEHLGGYPVSGGGYLTPDGFTMTTHYMYRLHFI